MRIVPTLCAAAFVAVLACGKRAQAPPPKDPLDVYAGKCGIQEAGMLSISGDIGSSEPALEVDGPFTGVGNSTPEGFLNRFCAVGDYWQAGITVTVCAAPASGSPFGGFNYSGPRFEAGKTYTFGSGANDTGSLTAKTCPGPECSSKDGDLVGEFKVTEIGGGDSVMPFVILGFKATNPKTGSTLTGCVEYGQ